MGGVNQFVRHNLSVYGTLIADMATIGTPLPSLTCDSDNASVIVTNNGNVPDVYTASIGGTDAADFTITSQSASPTLQNGGTFTYTIRFTPTKVGAETATVSVTRSSDGGVTGPFSLSGSGGSGTIGGTGNAPVTFIGNTSAAFTVMVSNTGTCPWTSGATVTVDPQFTCSTGSTTIAAGSSAPFSFTYTPTVAGGTTYPVTFPLSTPASSSVNVTIATATDDVAATSSNGFSLEQNYPNPFNETSQCEITLPVACVVHLSIVNVEGQVVQTLLNQHYDAGSFEVTLDATGLASGTYYYQMTAGNVTLTKQMVVLK